MKKFVKVINVTQQITIAERAEIAQSFLAKAVGLLGRSSISEGTGLVLSSTNSIHMFFMRFAIDALFIDKDGNVIKVLHSLKPWRISPIVWQAYHCIELPSETARMTLTKEGDQIALVSLEGVL